MIQRILSSSKQREIQSNFRTWKHYICYRVGKKPQQENSIHALDLRNDVLRAVICSSYRLITPVSECGLRCSSQIVVDTRVDNRFSPKKTEILSAPFHDLRLQNGDCRHQTTERGNRKVSYKRWNGDTSLGACWAGCTLTLIWKNNAPEIHGQKFVQDKSAFSSRDRSIRIVS